MGAVKIILTEETIICARDYVPYAEKKKFLDAYAGRCFDKLQINADGDAGIVAMPPMYKKNPFLVRRYMMGALAGLYLGIPFTVEEDSGVMSLDDYDGFCASHIFNQLDRLKSKVKSPENKDKIFDLLSDYREFEKMMNDEIYALLQVMNEPISRILASIQQTATPEYVKQAAEKLKAAQAEVERFAEERKAAENGDGGNG